MMSIRKSKGVYTLKLLDSVEDFKGIVFDNDRMYILYFLFQPKPTHKEYKSFLLKVKQK